MAKNMEEFVCVHWLESSKGLASLHGRCVPWGPQQRGYSVKVAFFQASEGLDSSGTNETPSSSAASSMLIFASSSSV